MLSLIKTNNEKYYIHDNKQKHECFYSLFLSLILDCKLYENWNLSFLNDFRFSDNNKPTLERYNKLLELNPKLKFLDDKYPNNKQYVYMGAVSLFNYNDIEYFLKYGGWSDSPLIIKNIQENFEYKIKLELQWVLSEETLSILEKINLNNVNITHIENVLKNKIRRIYEEKTIDYMMGCLSG